MSRRACLLEGVRGLIERTYRMRCGLGELAPFVIGDRGYRRLYSRVRVPWRAGAAAVDAGTLVRETPAGVKACIYFPDALIRRLEDYPPWTGLREENVEAFAVFVEEVDHLLLIAERARLERPLTLFELELHANVSKYLVLARFLAGAEGRLDPARRLWLRRELFGSGRFADPDPQSRARYRDAARWAVALLDALGSLDPAARLETLRRFHAATTAGKVELIRSLGGTGF